MYDGSEIHQVKAKTQKKTLSLEHTFLNRISLLLVNPGVLSQIKQIEINSQIAILSSFSILFYLT